MNHIAKPDNPLISIGMTVRNQGRYLERTLVSLLGQTYTHFELIISDNASEDNSPEICHAYANKDCRIRFIANPNNIGPEKNSYLVLNAASGDYYMWSSGHDMYAPEFLSRLMAVYQSEGDGVALCYPRTVLIDPNDVQFMQTDDSIDTRGLDACQRFKKIIWEFGWGNMVNGLFRMPVFKQAWRPFDVVGADHVFMANLSLYGTIAQVPEVLFLRRRTRPHEDAQDAKSRYVRMLKNQFEKLVPYTMMAFEHIKVVRHSHLDDADKVSLFEEIRQCFYERFKLKCEALHLMEVGTTLIHDSRISKTYKQSVSQEFQRLAKVCQLFCPDLEQQWSDFNLLWKL